MAETNVISQLKIKTGADSYETYDLKDNHMIFRDIYYRGRPSNEGTSLNSVGVYKIAAITGKSNVYAQIKNQLHTANSFSKFGTNDLFSQYKSKNMYLCCKWIYNDVQYPFIEFGRDILTIKGNCHLNENDPGPLVEAIFLYLEYGSINTYTDVLQSLSGEEIPGTNGEQHYPNHADAGTWSNAGTLNSLDDLYE